MSSCIHTQFLKDVVAGLSSVSKRLPSKYFYDEEGSRLFQEICALTEYYLPGCEREILENQSQAICGYIEDERVSVVELGAGDGNKTRVLLENIFTRNKLPCYYPVDICEDILKENENLMRRMLPELEVRSIVGDFLNSLQCIEQIQGRRFVLFLGSNIGNYDDGEAIKLLSNVRKSLRPGDLFLLGADLVKDPRAIVAAYDDSSGVTQRFNLNLLRRINRELGANFNLAEFSHYASYDPIRKEAASFLVSMRDQAVSLSTGEEFHFHEHETIHTEISRKYLRSDLERIASEAGFAIQSHFTDTKQQYVVSLFSC